MQPERPVGQADGRPLALGELEVGAVAEGQVTEGERQHQGAERVVAQEEDIRVVRAGRGANVEPVRVEAALVGTEVGQEQGRVAAEAWAAADVRQGEVALPRRRPRLAGETADVSLPRDGPRRLIPLTPPLGPRRRLRPERAGRPAAHAGPLGARRAVGPLPLGALPSPRRPEPGGPPSVGGRVPRETPPPRQRAAVTPPVGARRVSVAPPQRPVPPRPVLPRQRRPTPPEGRLVGAPPPPAGRPGLGP